MAKPAKSNDELEVSTVQPVTETITYIPGDGDPPSVKWCGLTFQANVPKVITGHAEGSPSEKLNAHLIERAKENKHFVVGENTRPKREATGLPTTAEQYRAYMVGWLKDPRIDHAELLIERFAKDRELRLACEVGHDDYSWLSTLFMPRLHQLRTLDELNDEQLASMWRRHGFNELPW
jgi:hypothetical protein